VATSDRPARGGRAGWILVVLGLVAVVGAGVVALALRSDDHSEPPGGTSSTAGPSVRPPPEGVPTDRVAVGPGAV
jgi:hypothetical protein